MKIAILGGAGFIGTNLVLRLAENIENQIFVADNDVSYFNKCIDKSNVRKVELDFNNIQEIDRFIRNVDMVYHLVSTNMPTSSNKSINSDIEDNIAITLSILECCVRNKVKKLIFISSGGTVYGVKELYPIKETDDTNPINTYGVQKLTIEKLIYLYNYIYGLNYSIIRLANPYGPYQRPNGRLGAVTTFVYKAMNDELITVYGDGSVVRDYIYIDDAIAAIINIACSNNLERIYNVGSGVGISINQLLRIISSVLNKPLKVEYSDKRLVDVPINYLDISRYEKEYGRLNNVSLEEGIRATELFMRLK